MSENVHALVVLVLEFTSGIFEDVLFLLRSNVGATPGPLDKLLGRLVGPDEPQENLAEPSCIVLCRLVQEGYAKARIRCRQCGAHVSITQLSTTPKPSRVPQQQMVLWPIRQPVMPRDISVTPYRTP
jgi:hypothetical protein